MWVAWLLDTCVLSELSRPAPNAGVVQWLEAADEETLWLSALTIGENRFGVAKLRSGARRRRLDAWVDDVEARFSGRVLVVGSREARRWGELRARLSSRGITLAVVDGLVAATAEVHGLTLVTRNVRDVAATGVRILDPFAT
jgi:predicted nucleic acid-binding protein